MWLALMKQPRRFNLYNYLENIMHPNALVHQIVVYYSNSHGYVLLMRS